VKRAEQASGENEHHDQQDRAENELLVLGPRLNELLRRADEDDAQERTG
jgi:hypothetical protein